MFNRGKQPFEPPAVVKRILGDRSFLPSFRQQFGKLHLDVVLDMCAYAPEDARLAVSTFQGIANRMVVISTSEVYRAHDRFFNVISGDLEAVPLTESAALCDLLNPDPSKQDDGLRRGYRYDKIAVERIVLNETILPGTILRLAAIYGPGDFRHRLFEFVKRMDDHRPAILMDKRQAEWRWTWDYVENTAAAIGAAIVNPRAAKQVYNIGESETLSFAERVRKIGQAAGWDGKLVLLDQCDLPEHLRQEQPIDFGQDLMLDACKIRNELGFKEKVSTEEALIRAVDWERQHPPETVSEKEFNYPAEDKY